MDTLERLTALFEKLPGIGPRQAGRFVHYLLRSSPAVRREFADAIDALGGSVYQCPECMRWHAGTSGKDKKLCSICTNAEREHSSIAVVATDADLAALESSGTYRGTYFVLGGTVSLASDKTNGLRIRQLLTQLNDLRSRYGEFTEVILAFPANPEGDATALQVRDDVCVKFPDLKITSLGRGLSTGSELEYADPETLRSALESRR